MSPRARLTSVERRAHLLEVAAGLFAERAYDAVAMEEVAECGGVSRALLYRHFPTKQDLFAAMYQQAADRLLDETALDPALTLVEQIEAGLDAHIDYFIANRNTVLAANRTLAGDRTIQAIIEGELDVLRERMIDAAGVDEESRPRLSAILMSWLVFTRVLTVEWLTNQTFSREELRNMCTGALLGALGGLVDVNQEPADQRGQPHV